MQHSLPSTISVRFSLIFLLLLFPPLSAKPPFNRFPNSPSGIYRLGTNTLGDYQKKLRLLTNRVNALEEIETPKNEKELKTEMLKKNGFNDEAQLEYLHHVVKWEMKMRKEKDGSGI